MICVMLMALTAASAGGFEHGWTTVQDQMWGWIGGDYVDAPNSSQIAWFAQNYGIVVVGSGPPGNLTRPGQFDVAAALKRANPAVKVLLYEASGFGALGFGQAEMQAHPEWCLTDDNGAPYLRPGPRGGCRWVDWRRSEVRDWFVHTANQSGLAGELFDGLMVDSAGPSSARQFRRGNHVMSDATARAVIQAKMDMLGDATAWFKSLNNGYVIGNPTLEWNVIGAASASRGPFPETYHWNFLRGTLDEMFGAFGTQDATGEWNAALMEKSFDAIINETTVFKGGDNAVLIRGYPGPVNVPFYPITSTTRGANPLGPNKSILVPTWPKGRSEAGPSAAVARRLPARQSQAPTWLQQIEEVGDHAGGAPQCSVLEGYFYYTWPAGRGANNTLSTAHAESTAECCERCEQTAGCGAFSYFKGATPGLCRLYRKPLPSVVPGPAGPQYDSGNLRGPAPRIEPGPTPGPHPPRPPPPPVYPYEGLAFPTTPRDAQAVSKALLHEALAPYLVAATGRTWFSYAWFYSTQSGWAPCPENPGACLAPDEWYPDLKRPIGRPLGPAVKAGATYTRRFEHATAFIDLTDRRKSRVTWDSHSEVERHE